MSSSPCLRQNTVKLQTVQLQAEQKAREVARRVEETLPERLAGAEQRRQQGIGRVVEKAREEVSTHRRRWRHRHAAWFDANVFLWFLGLGYSSEIRAVKVSGNLLTDQFAIVQNWLVSQFM